jgi:hypothetical protein
MWFSSAALILRQAVHCGPIPVLQTWRNNSTLLLKPDVEETLFWEPVLTSYRAGELLLDFFRTDYCVWRHLLRYLLSILN